MYANDNKSSFSVPSGTPDTSGITLEDKLPILLYGVDKDGVKKYGKSKDDVIDKFSTKANIDKFEAKWLESLQKAVEDKLNNSSVSPRTPVRDNMGQKHKNTKDMSLEEFIKYKKNNQ